MTSPCQTAARTGSDWYASTFYISSPLRAATASCFLYDSAAATRIPAARCPGSLYTFGAATGPSTIPSAGKKDLEQDQDWQPSCSSAILWPSARCESLPCRSSQGACAFAIEFLLALGRMCFSDSLASIIAQNQGLNHNSLPRETPPSDIQKHIAQLLQEGNACGCGRTQGFVSDIKLGSSTSNTSSMKKIETKLHRSADKPEKTNKQTHKRINDFPKVSIKART